MVKIINSYKFKACEEHAFVKRMSKEYYKNPNKVLVYKDRNLDDNNEHMLPKSKITNKIEIIYINCNFTINLAHIILPNSIKKIYIAGIHHGRFRKLKIPSSVEIIYRVSHLELPNKYICACDKIILKKNCISDIFGYKLYRQIRQILPNYHTFGEFNKTYVHQPHYCSECINKTEGFHYHENYSHCKYYTIKYNNQIYYIDYRDQHTNYEYCSNILNDVKKIRNNAKLAFAQYLKNINNIE